jgi:hypothetical protein
MNADRPRGVQNTSAQSHQHSGTPDTVATCQIFVIAFYVTVAEAKASRFFEVGWAPQARVTPAGRLQVTSFYALVRERT